MKIKDGFVTRKIMDEYVVVPVGERIADFNGLISVNESGALMWEALKQDVDESSLVDLLLEEYEIDRETASRDVSAFLKILKENDFLVN